MSSARDKLERVAWHQGIEGRPQFQAAGPSSSHTDAVLEQWEKQRILTLTESECSVILILVFLCQQTLRVDMVCV